MNSLVVLLSVMALAAASPSGLVYGPGVISYAAPAVAVAPSAVSHQSRVDIKSTPAVVSETITPVARAAVAEPAIVAAPTAYAAPIAYSAPVAPVAYSAPVAPVAYSAPAAFAAVAPAAVSSQSRVDIKSSPAVIDTVASAPWLNSVAAAPIAYSAPFAYAPSALAAVAPTVFRSAAIAPVAVAPAVAAPVASADLPVAPAETPEVAAARAAHLEAKAQAEAHSIHKRSAQIIPGTFVSPYSTPVVATYAHSPIVYSAPVAQTLGVPAPYIAAAL